MNVIDFVNNYLKPETKLCIGAINGSGYLFIGDFESFKKSYRKIDTTNKIKKRQSMERIKTDLNLNEEEQEKLKIELKDKSNDKKLKKINDNLTDLIKKRETLYQKYYSLDNEYRTYNSISTRTIIEIRPRNCYEDGIILLIDGNEHGEYWGIKGEVYEY